MQTKVSQADSHKIRYPLHCYFPGTLPTNQNLSCWDQDELSPMRCSAGGTTKLLSLALTLNLPPCHVFLSALCPIHYSKTLTLLSSSSRATRLNCALLFQSILLAVPRNPMKRVSPTTVLTHLVPPRGHPYMTSAKFWDFLTPSPLVRRWD